MTIRYVFDGTGALLGVYEGSRPPENSTPITPLSSNAPQRFNTQTGAWESATHLKISPVEFKLLFTSLERVAIKEARQTDPVVADFFEIVEDPRLTFVDLGLQSTHDALGYLVSLGLITSDRKAKILAGDLQ